MTFLLYRMRNEAKGTVSRNVSANGKVSGSDRSEAAVNGFSRFLELKIRSLSEVCLNFLNLSTHAVLFENQPGYDGCSKQGSHCIQGQNRLVSGQLGDGVGEEC